MEALSIKGVFSQIIFAVGKTEPHKEQSTMTTKDKAMVECTVGVVSTFILAAIRNEQFLSLLELNAIIRERLEVFNHKPFQKRDSSWASAFEEEKPFLLPLLPRPFELAAWKVASVGPNYHISANGMNYSVPYEYIKQKVDIRITRGGRGNLL